MFRPTLHAIVCSLSAAVLIGGFVGCASKAGSAASAAGANPMAKFAAEATPRGAPTVPLPADKNTYVLVHGAWGGGYAWNKVDDLLSAEGNRVFRVTLTGQGEHVNLASPDVDLDLHINDVVNKILWEDLHDVILMGHSYGGMVVTGVMDRVPDRIKRVVFVDAFLPNDGESLNSTQAAGGRGQGARGAGTRGAGRGPTTASGVPEGFTMFGRGGYNPNLPPPHDVPQSMKTLSQPVSFKNPAAIKLPATYILTVDPGNAPEQDTFFRFYQRAQERGYKAFTMVGDHNVHVSHPVEVAKYLKEAGEMPR